MSTKARLISTISAVCLILALLVTGVWAVSTANVTLGGTVTFTADNIHATITGSITGTQETVSITPLVYDADTVPSDEDKATWNNDVNFGTGNLITMKVKVKNESTERSLFVTVTDNTTTSNINKEFTSTVTDVGSGDTYEVIKGGEIEYTLTLRVAELDYSASATYALDVDLRDANAPAEEEEETFKLLHDTENDYYYVNMGTYNEQDVRWRVVAVNGEKYTYNSANDAPTGELTFIQETVTTTHTFDDSSNVYSTSDIRTYLTNEGEGGYINALGITAEDKVYSKIKARNDLHVNMHVSYGTGVITSDTEFEHSDKLWLYSTLEANTYLGDGGIVYNESEGQNNLSIAGSSKTIWGQTYWLRSRFSEAEIYSSCIATTDTDLDQFDGYAIAKVSSTQYLRPGFVLDVTEANIEIDEQAVRLYHDTENDYYYVKMGTIGETDVRWRVVGVNGAKYTYDETTAPEGELTFIQETVTTTHIFDDSSTAYSTSDVRAHLTNEGEGGYINALGITAEDKVYSKIKARNDLHVNMTLTTANVIYSATEFEHSDKLWLFSQVEIYTYIAGGTIEDSDSETSLNLSSLNISDVRWEQDYWTRSAFGEDDSLSTFFQISDNDETVDGCYGVTSPTTANYLRPGFVIDWNF